MSETPAPYYLCLPFDATDPVACAAWLRRWSRPAPPPTEWWLTTADPPPRVEVPRQPFAEWERDVFRRLRAGTPVEPNRLLCTGAIDYH